MTDVYERRLTIISRVDLKVEAVFTMHWKNLISIFPVKHANMQSKWENWIYLEEYKHEIIELLHRRS